MKEFIRAVPDQEVVYPYSLQQLQADMMMESGGNTVINVFADPLAFEQEPFYTFQVYPTTPPQVDLNTETLTKSFRFDEDAQRWVQVWTVLPLSEEEIATREQANLPSPDWVGFYNAILISNIYQTVVQTALVSGNTALSTSISLLANALTEANSGRANINAIQSAMMLVLATSSPTSENIEELSSLISAYYLPEVLLASVSMP
jgi:hypothetical protein